MTDMAGYSLGGVGPRRRGLWWRVGRALGDERIVDRRRIAIGSRGILGDPREALARLLGLALAVPHAGVEAAGGEQRLMGAALDDHPAVEHDDLVGAHDGGEP